MWSLVVSLRLSHLCVCFFFFFQAEDGIRDVAVTGVQTCALPILALAAFVWRFGDRRDGRAVTTFPGGVTPMVVSAVVLVGAEVLALTFVGSKVWAGIYQTPPDPNSLQIDVQSEQFAFYFRYPGP